MTEAAARKTLRDHGYELRKSRAHGINANDFGGYMITDSQINAVVAGSRYDLNLVDVEEFLAGLKTEE